MAAMRYAVLLSTFLAAVLGQDSCYYAAGGLADNTIVPCVASDSEFSSCCQVGDICLSANGCFNPGFGVTYFYGCTDQAYNSSVCPYKCGPAYANAPYVGLERCNNSPDVWSCTHPPDDGTSVEHNAPNCGNIAVAYQGGFYPVVSLPSDPGGERVFYSGTVLVPGYTPTNVADVAAKPPTPSPVASSSTSAAATTPMSTSSVAHSRHAQQETSSSAGITPTTPVAPAGSATNASPSPATESLSPTATQSPSVHQSSHGLSLGAKIGLGVGIGLGLLALIALLLFCFFRRRHRDYSAAPQGITANMHPTPTSPYTPYTDSGQWERSELSANERYDKPSAPRHYRDDSGGSLPPTQYHAQSPNLDSLPYKYSHDPSAQAPLSPRPFDRWSPTIGVPGYHSTEYLQSGRGDGHNPQELP